MHCHNTHLNRIQGTINNMPVYNSYFKQLENNPEAKADALCLIGFSLFTSQSSLQLELNTCSKLPTFPLNCK